MRLFRGLCLAVILVGCAQGPAMTASGPMSAKADSRAALPRPGARGGVIAVESLSTPFLKDPSFVDDGRVVGERRYIAFGDLRTLYVKPFTVEAGSLRFLPGELPLRLEGLPSNLDSPWAPHLLSRGDRMWLLYCVGEMPPPEGPRWGTFRLRFASMPLAAFKRLAAAGSPLPFQDHGVILDDLTPYGPNDRDFGVIDPHLYLSPQGRAFMTYAVVRGGIPGARAHEEFVRYREVSPSDPARALGPDMPMYDGRWPSEDDGVAEAQDVVTLKGQTYAFISSRPGDIDQKILIAPVPANLGPIARSTVRPFLSPGSESWRAKAVGSSGIAVVDGTPFMVYQALGQDRRFSLAWMNLEL